MEHTTTGVVAYEHHEHIVGGGRKEIYRVTIILSVLTIIELALGFSMYYITATLTLHIIKGIILILMLAKAFYIVSVFMHLGDEIRNMIMTIVVPLCLFIWFITAFLWDGNSWLNLKNTNAGSRPAQTEEHKPAVIEKGEKP